MATSQNVEFHLITGLVAGADLSAYQFHYCNLEADGDVNVTAVQTGALGILLNKPIAGEACKIAGPGAAERCKVAGNVTPGLALMVDTGNVGQLVKATDDKVVVATSKGTTASGALAPVLVREPVTCADVSDIGVGN